MMWDRVVRAWVALLEQDAALIAALGGPHIYPGTAARPIRIPSVEYVIVSDVESELFNAVILQVDFWARGVGSAITIEKRIRRTTHRDTSRVLAIPVPPGSPAGTEPEPIRVFARYLNGRTHDYRADPGVMHKSIDIQFEPVRARFHTTTGG
jgi:hypothetical protein